MSFQDCIDLKAIPPPPAPENGALRIYRALDGKIYAVDTHGIRAQLGEGTAGTPGPRGERGLPGGPMETFEQEEEPREAKPGDLWFVGRDVRMLAPSGQ